MKADKYTEAQTKGQAEAEISKQTSIQILKLIQTRGGTCSQYDT